MGDVTATFRSRDSVHKMRIFRASNIDTNTNNLLCDTVDMFFMHFASTNWIAGTGLSRSDNDSIKVPDEQ